MDERAFRRAKENGWLDMRGLLLACVFCCWVTGAAAGQNSKPVVEAQMVAATDAARAGSALKAAVVAKIAHGYHINDHQPAQEYLIPTELKLELPKQLSIKRIVYPKGEPKRFAFSDTPLLVYENMMAVGALLKVARKTPPGSYPVKGKFTYQACNDHACLPPTSVLLALTVKVVPRGVPLKRLNADVFSRIQFE